MGNFNVFSIIFCALILIYASYSDLRRRTVSNTPWLFMSVAGLALLAYQSLTGQAALLVWALASISSTFVITFLFFKFGLFGAADAKCLISMAVLFPKYPSFAVFSQGFPMLPSGVLGVFPLTLITLTYASILALSVPVFLASRNLLALGFRGFSQNLSVVFIGYRVKIDHIGRSQHIRLAHSYQAEGGRLKKKLTFGGVEIDAAVIDLLKSFQRRGLLEASVWVTPDLPFVVFITAGFLAAVSVGNVMMLVFA